jgi:biopolymer transport protein ExbD
MFAGRLDVAPFAGVFFLLVILLLLLTHLAPVPGVTVRLPEANLPDGAIGPDWLVVVMDAEGRLYFNQQITTGARLRDDLAGRLRTADAPVPVVLQAAASARLEDLISFYALCRQAGIEDVKLQTRSDPLTPGGSRTRP